jgi:hypothetical protein
VSLVGTRYQLCNDCCNAMICTSPNNIRHLECNKTPLANMMTYTYLIRRTCHNNTRYFECIQTPLGDMLYTYLICTCQSNNRHV